MIGGKRVDYFRDTLIERAFVGGCFINATPDQFGMVELWNPAVSGKHLIVSKMFIFSSTLSGFSLAHHNAALTIDGTRGNKYLNEPLPVGLIKTQAAGAVVGTAITEGLINPTACPLILSDLSIIVAEGLGLVVRCGLVNTQMSAQFEWIEVNA